MSQVKDKYEDTALFILRCLAVVISIYLVWIPIMMQRDITQIKKDVQKINQNIEQNLM